ncbi:SMAD/FHA domain-containing protein, partial [Thamnocephalis sphaerospora]
ETNGFFGNKVLSRSHAEIWSEGGKVYIKDVCSSNGTFINGTRLSSENQESRPFELRDGDRLDFGVD